VYRGFSWLTESDGVSHMTQLYNTWFQMHERTQDSVLKLLLFMHTGDAFNTDTWIYRQTADKVIQEYTLWHKYMSHKSNLKINSSLKCLISALVLHWTCNTSFSWENLYEEKTSNKTLNVSSSSSSFCLLAGCNHSFLGAYRHQLYVTTVFMYFPMVFMGKEKGK
jgi:Na+-transporting NADH:ubiquinone oxidoreductase subunit NqrB